MSLFSFKEPLVIVNINLESLQQQILVSVIVKTAVHLVKLYIIFSYHIKFL